ncbi:MAG: hypothetical protein ABSE53_00760 [Terracidiphilus sp.]
MTTKPQRPGLHFKGQRFPSNLPRHWPARVLVAAAVPVFVLLAGCGGTASGNSNGTFSVSPGTVSIDTNCTGCNASSNFGQAVEQFTATLNSGGAASVTWAVSGGDTNSGPGSISNSGQYTPPPYITANSVQVKVTATLTAGTGSTSSSTVTVTPGFLEPLSPENVALGANGSATITGYIAESGGSTGITYAASSSPTGSGGGQGSVGTPSCVRPANEFTYCTVTYTAPATVSSTSPTYVVATVGSSSSKTATEVLLNTAGISSNPATHQTQLPTPVLLGTSGGNNNDYDTQVQNGQTFITDCCGGTLGALIQNSSHTQYLLSCNHVLARSDQASAGEMIIQPGLIDNGSGACYPVGDQGTETQVGTLTTWLPLSSASTNADAAIAQVNSGAVSPTGSILELGLPGAGGVLAAAPPGISSTNGNGENGTINMAVAKSGRTTGLTCANISTVSLEVQVGYFRNCEETEPYLTKLYTNQIAIEANQFSDAGDSGSLVVDASNAEPVGLFFAGGVDSSGVSEGIANPVTTVLAELNAQENSTYTFVGTTDHPVSCLNYGNATATAAQGTALSDAQAALAQQALTQARMLINPSTGILGAATGKSSDHAGEATVILYVDQSMSVTAPQMVHGVRTEVIPTTPQAVAAGAVPKSALESNTVSTLASGVLTQAIAAKQQIEQNLMKQNPAFFGVGVGQSLDNPREAALVIYVDRRQVPATLAPTINGLRTRYIIMDRLHVTRSYLTGPLRQQSHCMAHPATRRPNSLDLLRAHSLPGLNLF